jgi:hypothetical protein
MKNHNEIESCASCGNDGCSLNVERKLNKNFAESTAFLLDEVCPEFDAYLSKKVTANDFLITTLNGKVLRLPRYAWSISTITKREYLIVHELLRSVSSRRLAYETDSIR